MNDELSELENSLKKTLNILDKDGLVLVVSFQSLEDRIVKDFLTTIVVNDGVPPATTRSYLINWQLNLK